MKSIALFCVNYNTYAELHRFCQSVEQAAEQARHDARVALFIADNTVVNPQPIEFSSKVVEVHTLQTGTNLGYMGGVQYIMNDVCLAEFDFVMISNVDLQLHPDAFVQLAAFKDDGSTGWIAPSIVSGLIGNDRNPSLLHRYTRRRLNVLRLMFKVWPLMVLYKRFFHNRRIARRGFPSGLHIYAGHGSCMILTNQYLRLCGKPNYPVFLFCEELYFAEQCRRANLSVVYYPAVRVDDAEHASVGSLYRRDLFRYNREALSYILKTFYNN